MGPETRLDRVQGALLGAAVGDALGAPLEGLSPQQIRAHYGVVDDYVDGALAWKKKPFRWRLPGLYTDDTQQALVLTDVLMECGGVDPDLIASYYLDLAAAPGSFAGAHRGVGRSFRQVLDALRQGIAPLWSGQPSAGTGAAMRIAPVALYHVGHPEGLFDAVMTASLITHRDCRSLAGAIAVAHAVRRLVVGAPRQPSLLFRLAHDVRRAELRMAAELEGRIHAPRWLLHSLSTAIAHVECVLDFPREQALSLLVEEANRHDPKDTCRRPTMGFAPALIPTCLYLLLTTDSFEEALVEAVNLGGDADTAGAILGAMAGASYGCEAIPTRWLERLQNREGIAARGEALWEGSTAGLYIPDLVATERQLCEREAACRNRLMAQQRQSDGDLGANRRI